MDFLKLIETSKQYFPKLEVKYKTESIIMKLMRIILFFNFKFMTYTTTIGNTVYLPSREVEDNKQMSRCAVFMHELVHIHDMQKLGFFGKLLFSASYLFPQILVLLGIPMLLVSWKVAIFFLLFLAPLPAYWRMKSERRAYFISLYVMRAFERKFKVNYQLEENKEYFIRQFTGPTYYFMWWFPGIRKQFDEALAKVERDEKPIDDPSLSFIDDILTKI